MVFSSFPAVYLDHSNLHQFQQQDHQQGSGVDNNQLPPPPPPLPVGGPGPAGAGGSIRPGSMVDRARLAKLPLPEAGLKCPRCDSTNTKFCYFNNYSLSQPRHFCKTCRRYWTRGGALRNVPVGGGCRRNKKNKSSSTKSSASSERQIGSNSTSTASPSNCSTDLTGHFPQPSTQLPLMTALQNLNHYGGGPMGSGIGGFQAQMMAANGNGLTGMGFSIGNNLGGGNGNDISTGGADQWRFPSIGGFEAPTNFFQFQSEGVEASSSMIGDQQLGSIGNSSGVSQLASVKSEQTPGLNLTKQFLVNSDNNQFWGTGSGSPWTGFSGLSSSSTSHLL